MNETVWLVIHDGALPSKVESQCHTFADESEATDAAKRLSTQTGVRYNVFKLVQTRTYKMVAT